MFSTMNIFFPHYIVQEVRLSLMTLSKMPIRFLMTELNYHANNEFSSKMLGEFHFKRFFSQNLLKFVVRIERKHL